MIMCGTNKALNKIIDTQSNDKYLSQLFMAEYMISSFVNIRSKII